MTSLRCASFISDEMKVPALSNKALPDLVDLGQGVHARDEIRTAKLV